VARRAVRRAVPALALCGALLPGCRSGPPPPDRSALDALDARAFVRTQALAVKDLSAQVSLSVETPSFSGSLEGAVLIAPPDRLRMRATKLLIDVFDLLVTNEVLELYWFPDRVLYRREPGGGAAPSTVSDVPAAAAADVPAGDARARAFLRDLDPAALRASLCAFELPAVDGSPRQPWQERAVAETVARTRAELTVVTTLEDGGILTRRFDGRSLMIRSAELARPGEAPFLRVAYDDYRPVAGIWLPRRSVMEDRRHQVVFTMEFSDVGVNEGVLPGAFTLAPPSDAKVVELK
jgi:hypothetical protein